MDAEYLRGIPGKTRERLEAAPKNNQKPVHEIEVKILEVDVEKTVAILLAAGAVKKFSGLVESIFLRNAKGDKIRLRTMDGKHFITHKTRLATEATDRKSNDEQETTVSDINVMETILVRTGFEVYARNQKQRTSYILGGATYEFDTIDGIPTYMEIEVLKDEDLQAAVERTGYAMEDTCELSEWKVRKSYEQKNKAA